MVSKTIRSNIRCYMIILQACINLLIQLSYCSVIYVDFWNMVFKTGGFPSVCVRKGIRNKVVKINGHQFLHIIQ